MMYVKEKYALSNQCPAQTWITAVMAGIVKLFSYFSGSVLCTATYPICPNMILILGHTHIYVFTVICSLDDLQTFVAFLIFPTFTTFLIHLRMVNLISAYQ
jgi:hypothetical protein